MKAKKMGLKSKGFGNWVDDQGQHYTTRGDKGLHKVDAPQSKGGKGKPDTGGGPAKDDVGGPAHPDAPEKKPSKPKIAKPTPYLEAAKNLLAVPTPLVSLATTPVLETLLLILILPPA